MTACPFPMWTRVGEITYDGCVGVKASGPANEFAPEGHPATMSAYADLRKEFGVTLIRLRPM